MKDQLNDSDKYDIRAIHILSHYHKFVSGKLMVKVTGLHGLGDDKIKVDDVNID